MLKAYLRLKLDLSLLGLVAVLLSGFYFGILKCFILPFICFRYTFLLVGATITFSVAGVTGYLSSLIRCPPQLPVFIGYFPPGERPGSQDALHLICCPSHLRQKVAKELEEKNINFPSEADSQKGMIPGHDRAYVSLSGGIKALDKTVMENVYLRCLQIHLYIISTFIT